MDPYSIFDTRMRGDFYNTGQLRRSTLTSLRWMAIAGQLASLAIVYFVLKINLPLLACFTVISASIVLNIAITLWAAFSSLVSMVCALSRLLVLLKYTARPAINIETRAVPLAQAQAQAQAQAIMSIRRH